MLNDPPGFDRSQMAGVVQKITAFFLRHLVQWWRSAGDWPKRRLEGRE